MNKLLRHLTSQLLTSQLPPDAKDIPLHSYEITPEGKGILEGIIGKACSQEISLSQISVVRACVFEGSLFLAGYYPDSETTIVLKVPPGHWHWGTLSPGKN